MVLEHDEFTISTWDFHIVWYDKGDADIETCPVSGFIEMMFGELSVDDWELMGEEMIGDYFGS